MASEEKKNSIPALIDYGSEGSDPNATVTGTELRKYWEDQLSRLHRTGTLPWTIKDKALWKRLIAQYGDELYQMIDVWMIKTNHPAKFLYFYNDAPAVSRAIKPKDYEWN